MPSGLTIWPLPAPRRGVADSLRARVLVALVAEDAVVDLAQDLARLMRGSVSPKPSRRRSRVRTDHPFRHLRRGRHLDESRSTRAFPETGNLPSPIRWIMEARRAPPPETLDCRRGARRRLPRSMSSSPEPARATASSGSPWSAARPALARDPTPPTTRSSSGKDVTSAPAFTERQHAAADEVHLEAERGRPDARGRRQLVSARLRPERGA